MVKTQFSHALELHKQLSWMNGADCHEVKKREPSIDQIEENHDYTLRRLKVSLYFPCFVMRLTGIQI